MTVDAVLPEFTRVLREGRLRPRAFVEAFRALSRASQAALGPDVPVRRSYARAVAGVIALTVGLHAWLALHVSALALALAVVGQILWAYAFFRLAAFHLFLVRDDSGRILDSFGLPNILTLMRLVQIPTVMAFLVAAREHPELRVGATVIYAFTAFSDLLDGALARTIGPRSDWGRVYDPFGDQLFNPLASVALSVAGAVPWWLTLIVVFRYWVVLVGAFLVYVLRGPYRVMPTWLGKISGFTLGWVLGAAVLDLCLQPAWLGETVLLVLFLLSAALSGATGLFLVAYGFRLHPEEPPDRSII